MALMAKIFLCGQGVIMGIETLLTVAIITQAINSITSGITSDANARAEAANQESQAELAKLESDVEADRVAKENDKFKKRQKMLFIKSGISLVGSPLLILEETQRESEKEVSAIRAQGTARRALGFAEAQQVRNVGRAKLVGGFTQATTGALTDFALGKQAGIFD